MHWYYIWKPESQTQLQKLQRCSNAYPQGRPTEARNQIWGGNSATAWRTLSYPSLVSTIAELWWSTKWHRKESCIQHPYDAKSRKINCATLKGFLEQELILYLKVVIRRAGQGHLVESTIQRFFKEAKGSATETRGLPWLSCMTSNSLFYAEGIR